MNETVAEIKASVVATIDDLRPTLIELSKRIHRNPEVKFQEHQASRWLSEAARKAGFQVNKPLGGARSVRGDQGGFWGRIVLTAGLRPAGRR